MKAIVLVRKALVKLIHLDEILQFGSVHLGHSIKYVSKRRFLLMFAFACFYYLKSTSSAVRDLGSRSSSRRKDALVRCVCMCVRG